MVGWGVGREETRGREGREGKLIGWLGGVLEGRKQKGERGERVS